MIQNFRGLAVAVVTIAAASQARADFRLKGYPAPHLSSASDTAPASSASQVQDEEHAAARAVPSPFKVAHGFGNDVPLSFAARQIVPPTVTVRYGRGVDPNAAVSWKGEAPWNRALAAALRPLQLRLTTGASSVLISR